MSVDQGGRSPETLLCQACGVRCPDPRALAVHTERHRPVDPPTVSQETGRETSHPCAAGCGRNFVSLAQYREHAPICDGQRPLEPFLDNRKTDAPKGRTVDCPECKVSYGDLEVLSVHLERHREVLPPHHDAKTGELMSRPCPKDCGRNFLSKREYKEHTELCDGSKPLPSKKTEEPLVVVDDAKQEPTFKTAEEMTLSKSAAKKEGESGMLTCKECDPPRSFTRPGPFALHLKSAHKMKYTPSDGAPAKPGRKPRAADPENRPARPPASSPASSGSPEAAASEGLSLSNLKEKANELRRRADRLEEIATAVDLLVKEAQTLL